MSSRPGPAFVAGATGYVGQAVVSELRQRGIETVAHVRPDSRDLDGWGTRFGALGAIVDLTPWDAVTLAERFRSLQPRLVFALLGTTAQRAKAGGSTAAAEYERVDFGMSRILVDAARDSSSVECFVYLSAAGVNPQTSNPYLAVRYRLESELHASGVRSLIARPAFVTGPDRAERRPVERLAALLTDGMLDIVGAMGARSLQARWHSLTGSELARGLVRLALNGSSANRTVYAEALRNP